MRIATIIGTRPNFIKCAPVSRELRKHHEELLVHTGQHYDFEMNKIFFDELDLPEPDFHLGVGSGTHAWQTGQMLRKIEKVLLKITPDFVIVYGDCNNAIAGALAAAKLHIQVGHIEAGLRSFDRTMPEEINRVLTDHCSDLLFCPTKTAVMNLHKEGVTSGVHLVGDVMVDALHYNKKLAEETRILQKLDLKPQEYLVATLHRQANTDNKHHLERIVEAFCAFDETLVFPVHPRAEKQLQTFGLWERLKQHVKLVKPLGYLEFLKLLNNARMILTDSGGIQKEAYILGIPCVTLRENTEWVETVYDGWNVLVGTRSEAIMKIVRSFHPDSSQKDVFGDGKASKNIATLLSSVLEL
jgi:UDP-N-acetylglucosamine 2-epimerase (non-hydrolysing)